LVITEGQLDSMTVATAGIKNAVSVPTGAMGFTWIPYCWDWMTRFDEIVVFGDCEKGKITLLEEISKRFPNKVKHVQEKHYRGCKDANEILLKHGPAAIVEAVENAIPIPVKRVIPLADVEDVNIFELPKLETGIKRLDDTLYGGIPFGIVGLIAGKRGDGKSTLASQIIANAIDAGHKVFVYSGELPNYLFKAWLDFQIAGRTHVIDNTLYGRMNRFVSKTNKAVINDWYREKAFIYDNQIVDDDEKEDLLKTIVQSIQQHNTKVILIDNLMTAMYIDEKRGTDKYDQQGQFVRALTKIALQYDCLILLVAHRRKNSFTTDANDEVSGSGDITNLAGLVLSYDRGAKADFDAGMNEGQRKLIVAKNRLFGKIDLNGIILDYDEKSKRIYGTDDDIDRQFGWDKSDGFFDIDDDVELPFEE
jgi:archaellum biogenesis ATPase FlaH